MKPSYTKIGADGALDGGEAQQDNRSQVTHMNRGGIFSGPNALGNVGLGAVGTSCQPDNSALIMKVQTYLKKTCPNLHVDGMWQGCTASAFRNATGRPYVTCEDIKNMTGQDCSSDDCTFGGILPAFSFASLNQCTDQSDGCAGGSGSGGQYEQKCPAGQVWNALLQTCVPDIFGTNKEQPTTQQTTCPTGQTWNDLLKTCVPDLSTMPGTQQPDQCPSGSIKNPLDGKCYGQGGMGTQPTECPSGMTKLPIVGTCVALPGGGGGGGASTSDPVGGLINAIQGMFGGGQQQTTPGGQPVAPGGNLIGDLFATINQMLGGGVQCPPGSVYNPGTKGCTSAAGPVVPVGTQAQPASPFGTSTYVIGGILLLGALGGGYYLWKRSHADDDMPMDEYDPMTDPLLLGLGGIENDPLGSPYGSSSYGMSPYGGGFGYAYPNRRRGRKSRRRSRRRGRRSSCRCR